MAQDLDDGEFWLPSEFLTDDDLFADFKADLTSPVESVVGSTETESDEDEFITFLTRGIANSTMRDSKLTSDETEKAWKLFGSPQSTLCGHKPKYAYGITSPPEIKDIQGRDLMCAAAGEAAKIGGFEKTASLYATNTIPPSIKRGTATLPPASLWSVASGYYVNHKLQAEERMLKQGVWRVENSVKQFQSGNIDGVERARGFAPAAWPSLQQSRNQMQPFQNSGMRAVFLGDKMENKERSGTGVFLPRQYGTNSTETRTKAAGCSTVLLPERVVYALNLNLDSVNDTENAQCSNMMLFSSKEVV